MYPVLRVTSSALTLVTCALEDLAVSVGSLSKHVYIEPYMLTNRLVATVALVFLEYIPSCSTAFRRRLSNKFRILVKNDVVHVPITVTTQPHS